MSSIDKIPGPKLFSILPRPHMRPAGKTGTPEALWKQSQARAAGKAENSDGRAFEAPARPCDHPQGTSKPSLEAPVRPCDHPQGASKPSLEAPLSGKPAQSFAPVEGYSPPGTSVTAPTESFTGSLKPEAVAGGSLDRATREFEAVFLRYLASALRRTMSEAQGKSPVPGANFYEGMIDEQLARVLAGREGGLAEVLNAQLQRGSEAGDDAAI